MKQPGILWLAMVVALVPVTFLSGPQARAQDEDDLEATVSALQTSVAGLQTQVADLERPDDGGGGNNADAQDTEQSPTPDPNPEPGTVLYEADWSNGFGEWKGSPDWKSVGGLLVNDGNNNESDFSVFGGAEVEIEGSGLIVAPDVIGNVENYAVESEIQFIGAVGDNYNCKYYSFGIIGRVDNQGGYMGGGGQYAYCGGLPSTVGVWHLENLVGEQSAAAEDEAIASQEFDFGQEWHTYRLEFEGNMVRLLVDDTLILEQPDNQYLSPGGVGLWSNGVELSVRSFTVIAL